MPTASYGSYSPQEDNPFPIETDLARIASGADPTAALNMLDRYRVERATAMGNYNLAMGGQHDFAKQQLAAQIADNAAKNLKGFMDVPGGYGAIANTPGYGYLTGGASPDQQAAFTGQQTRLQNAEIAQKGGAAAYSLAQAGNPATNESVSGVTGLQTNVGVPIGVQEAQIKASNQKPEHYQLPVHFETPDGVKVDTTVAIPFGSSQEEIQRRVDEARRGVGVAYPNQGNVPGMNTGGGSQGGTTRAPTGLRPQTGGSEGSTTAETNPLLGPLAPTDGLNRPTPTPQPSVSTNLPPAPTPAPASGGPQQQGTNAILDPHVQQAARIALKVLPPAARLDVAANSPGAVLPVVPLEGGNLGVRGKSGQIYPLPKVAANG